MIPSRLQALRQIMQEKHIDIYMIPTADPHESEYPGPHFWARRYMTGFTGSAGTAVITMEEAGLWTDGRYFIQAEGQLAGSGVTLYRMGEEGVPTVSEFIGKKIPQGGCLGFDGRTVNMALCEKLEKAIEGKSGTIYNKEDLVDLIWTDRPAMSHEPAFLLGEQYSGRSAADKIAQVRKVMEEKKAEAHIITTLDDVCWLFNVRGNDAPHFPIVLSFAVLTMDQCCFFVQDGVLNEEIREYLEKNNVTVMKYEDIYAYVASLQAKRVLLDQKNVNSLLVKSLPEGCTVINAQNPTILMKAIKNPVELDNIIKAHVKDGVAFTKFMYWLKTGIGKLPLTEITATERLEEFRREQGAIDISFDTICAYEDHAAMMHYSATPKSDVILQKKGLLLVDSGGHYMEGSTDITRTMALGPVTDQQKRHFTAVLIANLNLASAKFLYGCCGYNLDVLCRGPIWDMGLDYKCGTGHGVGYLLSIHEPPNGFRWRGVPERIDGATMEEGMVTTDEPGIYLEGKYGIRTENELICRKAEKNEYGQFMEFQNITYAPIDLDAVDEQYMTALDKERLNRYHKMVYDTLAPYMTEQELEWLKHYTRPI